MFGTFSYELQPLIRHYAPAAVAIRVLMLDFASTLSPQCWGISAGHQYYLHWTFDVVILPSVCALAILLLYCVASWKEKKRQASMEHEDDDQIQVSHRSSACAFLYQHALALSPALSLAESAMASVAQGSDPVSKAILHAYIVVYLLVPRSSFRIFEALEPCRRLDAGACDLWIHPLDTCRSSIGCLRARARGAGSHTFSCATGDGAAAAHAFCAGSSQDAESSDAASPCQEFMMSDFSVDCCTSLHTAFRSLVVVRAFTQTHATARPRPLLDSESYCCYCRPLILLLWPAAGHAAGHSDRHPARACPIHEARGTTRPY
jgi:hypothetical protein